MSSPTSNFLAHNVAGSLGVRKVAIPRLQRPSQPQGSSKDRRRVARACTACRNHKIKCSGDTPRCTHCDSTGRECIYIMPRKDRLKIVTERCAQMANLLKGLRRWANEEDNARIGELLEDIEEDSLEIPQPPTSFVHETDGDDSREPRALPSDADTESQGPVDVASLDLLDENLHEDDRSRATGFVGKNSEVQWLRTILHQEQFEDDPANVTKLQRPSSSTAGSNVGQVSAVTFYLDSEKVDLDFYVEAHKLPTPEMAERLLAVYMQKVHECFPILPRRLFEDQFRRYFKDLEHGTAARLNPKWQAILNMVFAIAARYSHLIKASWSTDERDHLVYHTRAREFGWNEATLTQHPDLPQIQVAGMLAFYYLSIGQVSRAWVVIGMALRFAHALGLHVRNEDPSATGSKREILVRVWWSLYSLERQLSVITGRPSVIVDSCCSVLLPIPFPEDQMNDDTDITARMQRPSPSTTTSSTLSSPTFTSAYTLSSTESPRTPMGSKLMEANSGSQFRAIIQLDIITQSILSTLYSAGATMRSPVELQQEIIQFGQRLDNWVTLLPTEFNFQVSPSDVTTPSLAFFRERTLLGFQFYSAKILLTRPCLGGIWPSGKDGKGTAMPASFLRAMVNICIDAAKAELDLVPDVPNPLFIYEYGPWWNIVHHLMQAVAILLLALSSSFFFQDVAVLSNYAKKTIRWLRSMYDPLAKRAYRVAFNSFQVVANRLSLDISDLWMEHAMAYPNPDTDAVGEDNINQDVFPMAGDARFGPTDQRPPVFTLSGTHPGASTFAPFDPRVAGPAFHPQTDGLSFEDSLYR